MCAGWLPAPPCLSRFIRGKTPGDWSLDEEASCPGWFEHRDPSLRQMLPGLGRSTVQGSAWALPLIRGSLHTLESKEKQRSCKRVWWGEGRAAWGCWHCHQRQTHGPGGRAFCSDAMLLASTISREYLSMACSEPWDMWGRHTCSLSSVHSRQEGKPYPWGPYQLAVRGPASHVKVWFGLL